MDNSTLNELINDFKYLNINREYDACNSVKSFDELIDCCIKSPLKSKNVYYKHKTHQWRIKPDVLENMLNNIDKSKLLKAKTFEAFLKIIDKPRKDKIVTGFAALSIYDAALRYGYSDSVNGHKAKILPKYVYLHNGTKTGANKLFKALNQTYTPHYHAWDTDREFPYLKKGELPSPIKDLKPYEIEAFLCIYKDRFK